MNMTLKSILQARRVYTSSTNHSCLFIIWADERTRAHDPMRIAPIFVANIHIERFKNVADSIISCHSNGLRQLVVITNMKYPSTCVRYENYSTHTAYIRVPPKYIFWSSCERRYSLPSNYAQYKRWGKSVKMVTLPMMMIIMKVICVNVDRPTNFLHKM